MSDPFTPGPYERIGSAIADLALVRRTLYSESVEDLFERAVRDSPSPYAFAYGSMKGNLDMAKVVIDRLWGDLVSIERTLMPPEAAEAAEVEW